MAIKNRLKEIRHDHRMNQIEFSAFLGIGQSQYNRYELQRNQPTLEVALEISEKLGQTVNHIFCLDKQLNN